MFQSPSLKDISGCAIASILNTKGKGIKGDVITSAISVMRERSNGLGGGFAAYGIYPEFKDYYAFHIMFVDESIKESVEAYLQEKMVLVKSEAIPTRKKMSFLNTPLLWRYFLEVPKSKLTSPITEEDYVVSIVMKINKRFNGAFVFSSGKNMGVFKGLGYPEDISRFYRLEEYEGYLWTAHGRFPTNTPGWWGGAHPFALLDWSVVHNGEISSYGTNKRYVETFGYECSLLTDTEVIVYLLDLLIRRHGLPIDIALNALAPPFWAEIDSMDKNMKEALSALRMVYASALLNGPFSIIIANSHMMIGLTDRIMLRPLVAAKKDDFYYMASEEAAIREICIEPDTVWSPKGGEPIVVRMEVRT
ncbi:class II glutamine amidotransferase [Thermovenabulum gondwanense]|uniref:Glutamate synthase [NADPH] large chain n=1 Tax=Thermovenabulum gondwanense TaxID=520767 RepID=A0A162MY90_9FIRM|nr:glutamine amidotransferase family protein [Thermovenabulum gondwanense]KYO68411.1 Glutamate synthase [NADPH] large chain [Thermovenabulum gondwanense]